MLAVQVLVPLPKKSNTVRCWTFLIVRIRNHPAVYAAGFAALWGAFSGKANIPEENIKSMQC